MGNEQAKLSHDEARRQHIQKMDSEIRRRLQKGVQYNMKVVIRGDKNTGKTTLLRRLQGQEFREEYIPSTQIQTAHIMWNYKVSDDNVKVEVWDVVDRARDRRSSSTALYSHHPAGHVPVLADGEDDDDNDDDGENSRLEHLARAGSSGRGQSMAVELDASMVNVYQGTHAVIFIFDMQKRWTWDYITRNIRDVPVNMEVLILANFRDEGERRVVTKGEVESFFNGLDDQRRRHVRYLECSLKNLFGIQQLYTFLNIPFLRLKKDYYLKQVRLVDAELDTAVEEVDLITREQNYDKYVELLRETKRRRRLPSFRTSATQPSSAPAPEDPRPPPSSHATDTFRGTSSSLSFSSSPAAASNKSGKDIRGTRSQLQNGHNKDGRLRHASHKDGDTALRQHTKQYVKEDDHDDDDFYGGTRRESTYTDESDTNASTNITTMPYDSDDGTEGKGKGYGRKDDDDDEEYSSDEDGEGMVMMDPADDIEEDMSEMYISAPKRTAAQRVNNDDSEASLDQIPSRRSDRTSRDTKHRKDDNNDPSKGTSQNTSNSAPDEDIEAFLGDEDDDTDEQQSLEKDKDNEEDEDENEYENENVNENEGEDDNYDIEKDSDEEEDENDDDSDGDHEYQTEDVKYSNKDHIANESEEQEKTNDIEEDSANIPKDNNSNNNTNDDGFIPGSDPPAIGDNIEIPLEDDDFFNDVNDDAAPSADNLQYNNEDDEDDEEEGEEGEEESDNDNLKGEIQDNDAKLKEAQEAAAAAAAKLEAELNEEEEQKRKEKEERRLRRKKKEAKERERKKRRKRKKKEDHDEEGETSEKKPKKKRSKSSKDRDKKKRHKKRRKRETADTPHESNE